MCFQNFPTLTIIYREIFFPSLQTGLVGTTRKKKTIANNSTGKFTSLIPEQGQFHVALNAVEDTVIIFKHFFDKQFSFLFGGLLPKKPRPYQWSLCVTAALLG